ncbi:Conserved hypothetical protein [Synechococcus sp. WH 7803]|nr:Conserved hypothetical protein [Synechococcus sp. WH 7803]
MVGCQRSSDLDRTVDNPRGYFESTLLRPLNDDLLAMAGYGWDRPPLAPVHWSRGECLLKAVQRKGDFEGYALSRNWVDKDPRLSLTRPFFDHLLLRRVPGLIAFRHPLDVARSLWLRDGFSLEKGMMIWFLYNRGCALSSRQGEDALVSYEDLLEGETESLQRVGRAARLSADFEESDSALEKTLRNVHAQFSDQSLQRNRTGSGALDPETAAHNQFDQVSEVASQLLHEGMRIHETLRASGFDLALFQQCFQVVPQVLIDQYDRLSSEGAPSLEFLRMHEVRPHQELSLGLSAQLSTGQYGQDQEVIADYAKLLETVHALRRELSEAQSGLLAESVQVELADRTQEVESLKQELANAQQDLHAVCSSTSWKMTAPLRRLIDVWR